jgi:hypothetical protein
MQSWYGGGEGWQKEVDLLYHLKESPAKGMSRSKSHKNPFHLQDYLITYFDLRSRYYGGPNFVLVPTKYHNLGTIFLSLANVFSKKKWEQKTQKNNNFGGFNCQECK